MPALSEGFQVWAEKSRKFCKFVLFHEILKNGDRINKTGYFGFI